MYQLITLIHRGLSHAVVGLQHLRNLLLSIDLYSGESLRTIGLTPVLYLHINAGLLTFQDGMFHKKYR